MMNAPLAAAVQSLRRRRRSVASLDALAGIPVGAMATTGEIGDLVAFVCRPDQISLNGAVLDVNGGSYLR